MHCPSAFRETRLPVLHELMARHPLGTLITACSGGLIANLVPFSLHSGGEHGLLRAHLARNNQQLEALREGAEVLVVFQGPQGYVTPSWYPSKAEHGKAVPTWNYCMVQVRGQAQVIEQAGWLREQLEQLTANHENQRSQPWQVSDAPADYISAQLRGIVGVEIPIAAIEGKWKMSQNQSPANRQGVIDGLNAESESAALLDMMLAGSGEV